MDGQGAVEVFALDSGGLGYFGDALGLGQVAQNDQEDAGLDLVSQGAGTNRRGRFKIGTLKIEGIRLPKSSWQIERADTHIRVRGNATITGFELNSPQ